MNPDWPFGWMGSSFATAAVAIVAPWLSRRHRLALAIGAAVVTAAVFVIYEIVLHANLPSDTVIFQLELFLLGPLVAAAALSCGLAAWFAINCP